MSLSHLCLAMLVVLIWGLNFIFVELCLKEISPLLLCSIRFLLASFPAIFFIKKPDIPIRYLISYGLITFGLQFSLLFLGMYAGMSPGLASLLMQMQVFFSVLFAFLFLNENPTKWQILGALIAFTGIALVWVHLNGETSFLGFLLIILASASWGMGNLITKKMGSVNMMALVVWGSFIAAFPLCFISLWVESPQEILTSLEHMTFLGITSLLFIVYASTWVGYGVWNWLVSRYNVSTIVPFTLLVPIIAMISSILFLNESFDSWKVLSAILVIMGLGVNVIAVRFFVR